MIYWATVVFILLNGQEEPVVAVPVGGAAPKCTEVLQHMIAKRVDKGGVKHYRPACVLMPTPK
jgi:hypothetical protein